MAEKKSYVRIQSKITIQVTCGLQNQDVTNPDAHVPDRLKISPDWPRGIYIINEGVGTYPVEILSWPTVKALEKDKIITVGEYVEHSEVEEDVKNKRDKLILDLDEIGLKPKKETKEKVETKPTSLADLAGE